MSEKLTLKVEIENLTDAQAEAIEDLLATWQSLGNLGASRWTAFYADGDGNFRPRVLVNGVAARMSSHLLKGEKWPEKERRPLADYAIDFDLISMKRRQKAEAR